MIVFDSSAVLAFLLRESGGDDIADALAGSIISTVNLAEIVTVLSRGGNPQDEVRAVIADLALVAVPPDEAMALDAGFLHYATRSAGLSLGDRFCLALARKLGAPVMTADRAWVKVGTRVAVEVRVIR